MHLVCTLLICIHTPKTPFKTSINITSRSYFYFFEVLRREVFLKNSLKRFLGLSGAAGLLASHFSVISGSWQTVHRLRRSSQRGRTSSKILASIEDFGTIRAFAVNLAYCPVALAELRRRPCEVRPVLRQPHGQTTKGEGCRGTS